MLLLRPLGKPQFVTAVGTINPLLLVLLKTYRYTWNWMQFVDTTSGQGYSMM